jgi:dGTPase
VTELFYIFMSEPGLLPPDYQEGDDAVRSGFSQERQVADYIAGMTDRYAIREHRKLFQINEM